MAAPTELLHCLDQLLHNHTLAHLLGHPLHLLPFQVQELQAPRATHIESHMKVSTYSAPAIQDPEDSACDTLTTSAFTTASIPLMTLESLEDSGDSARAGLQQGALIKAHGCQYNRQGPTCSMRSPSTNPLHSARLCSFWNARHCAWPNPPTPLTTFLRQSCTAHEEYQFELENQAESATTTQQQFYLQRCVLESG